MRNQKNKEPEISWWTYMYLINEEKENEYLTSAGQFVKILMEYNGECKSLSIITKKMKSTHSTITLLSKRLEQRGHIVMKRKGNKKIVCFSDDVMKKGIRLANHSMN